MILDTLRDIHKICEDIANKASTEQISVVYHKYYSPPKWSIFIPHTQADVQDGDMFLVDPNIPIEELQPIEDYITKELETRTLCVEDKGFIDCVKQLEDCTRRIRDITHRLTELSPTMLHEAIAKIEEGVGSLSHTLEEELCARKQNLE